MVLKIIVEYKMPFLPFHSSDKFTAHLIVWLWKLQGQRTRPWMDTKEREYDTDQLSAVT